MATFQYVDIPQDAIRLKSSPQDSQSHSVRPAAKILTPLPDTTTPAPSLWRIQFDGITITPSGATGTTANAFVSPTKAALSLVPQLLLSSSLPTSASSLAIPSIPPSTTSTATGTLNSRAPPQTLLTTRDPLSLPIMTSNFRRFVAKVGPMFWLQDRIEEVVLWKKGWKRTTVFLAAYGFLCYFPRMALLIPHALLLGVMLAYYPDPGAPSEPIHVSEGTVDWQANIQAIQNLMGTVSDVHDAIIPLLPLLVPPPQTPQSQPSRAAPTPSPTRNPPPPSPTQSRFKSSTSSISTPTPASTPTHQPKPPTIASPANPSASNLSQHSSEPSSPTTLAPSYLQRLHHPVLLFTLLSFLLLLPVLMADVLPLRLLFFAVGAGGVGCMHPFVRGTLVERGALKALLDSCIPFSVTLRLPEALLTHPFSYPFSKLTPKSKPHTPTPSPRDKILTVSLTSKRVRTVLRRLADDDRLEDGVWGAPTGEVELWENERWAGESSGGGVGGRRGSVIFGEVDAHGRDESADGGSGEAGIGAAAGTRTGTERGTWSKANLRVGERVGWTRGRDGWSGVGGEVSSNLTFSLSPGWAFVETEGWRPDLEGQWAVEATGTATATGLGTAADEYGWSYTSDTWDRPCADARPGEGWVTRRRRWVRRVYWRGNGDE
ncbi:hypothetical protein BU15DRAFT_61505 [Melanogaster broomeanus]|nr:hypothetical protein BU15DRAFT_61505 [Melanogaster broomeanus]